MNRFAMLHFWKIFISVSAQKVRVRLGKISNSCIDKPKNSCILIRVAGWGRLSVSRRPTLKNTAIFPF